MKTRTYSTIANAAPLTGSIFLTVGPGQAVDIVVVEGFCGGASGSQMYIQLLNTSTPTTGVTIPLWSRQISTANGFSFVYADIPINTANMSVPPNDGPVFAFISSTNEQWTSTATSCDCDVIIQEFEQQTDNGQATSNARSGSLTVWTDDYAAPSNPPHTSYNLLSLTITNISGADVFPMIFTSTGQATNGAFPARQISPPPGDPAYSPITGALATGQSYTWKFGGTGATFFSFDSTGVGHGGCYVYASSTTTILTTIPNGCIFSAIYNTGFPQ